MGDGAKQDRWHSTVRGAQVNLLDEEAKARGLTRSEMFLVALTNGLDELRAKRLGKETSGEKSESSEPTSREENAKPKASSAKRPAAKAAPAPVPTLEGVIRSVDGFATETPPQGKPAPSTTKAKPDGLDDCPPMLRESITEISPTTAALAELGITPDEVGENPFSALNDEPPTPAPVSERDSYPNPFDALNDEPPVRSL